MQYTVIAIIYADGTTQYIAIDGAGQPLDPQPDLTNAIPCPTDSGTDTGGGSNPPECCPDYSTATLQTQIAALQTTANSTLANVLTVLQNILLNVSAPVAPTPYRVLHGIVGTGGTLPNPFTLPANCISVEVIPLAVNPTNLNVYNAATLLGNKLTDDGGTALTLAVLSSWKAERRQLTGGAWQTIGGNIKIEATAGGSIFVIYETT